MTILGLDPGLAVTGYGFLRHGRVVSYGTISTPAGRPLSERIVTIVSRLDQLVRRYRPQACAVETLFFKAVGARSVILTAQLRGGLFYLMGRHRVPVTEITPATIKLTLTGNGRAAKGQMQYMIRALLQTRGQLPDHAADALAAAYCLNKRLAPAGLRTGSVLTARRRKPAPTGRRPRAFSTAGASPQRQIVWERPSGRDRGQKPAPTSWQKPVCLQRRRREPAG